MQTISLPSRFKDTPQFKKPLQKADDDCGVFFLGQPISLPVKKLRNRINGRSAPKRKHNYPNALKTIVQSKHVKVDGRTERRNRKRRGQTDRKLNREERLYVKEHAALLVQKMRIFLLAERYYGKKKAEEVTRQILNHEFDFKTAHPKIREILSRNYGYFYHLKREYKQGKDCGQSLEQIKRERFHTKKISLDALWNFVRLAAKNGTYLTSSDHDFKKRNEKDFEQDKLPKSTERTCHGFSFIGTREEWLAQFDELSEQARNSKPREARENGTPQGEDPKLRSFRPMRNELEARPRPRSVEDRSIISAQILAYIETHEDEVFELLPPESRLIDLMSSPDLYHPEGVLGFLAALKKRQHDLEFEDNSKERFLRYKIKKLEEQKKERKLTKYESRLLRQMHKALQRLLIEINEEELTGIYARLEPRADIPLQLEISQTDRIKRLKERSATNDWYAYLRHQKERPSNYLGILHLPEEVTAFCQEARAWFYGIPQRWKDWISNYDLPQEISYIRSIIGNITDDLNFVYES